MPRQKRELAVENSLRDRMIEHYEEKLERYDPEAEAAAFVTIGRHWSEPPWRGHLRDLKAGRTVRMTGSQLPRKLFDIPAEHRRCLYKISPNGTVTRV